MRETRLLPEVLYKGWRETSTDHKKNLDSVNRMERTRRMSGQKVLETRQFY
jgi:hypothetical protein